MLARGDLVIDKNSVLHAISRKRNILQFDILDDNSGRQRAFLHHAGGVRRNFLDGSDKVLDNVDTVTAQGIDNAARDHRGVVVSGHDGPEGRVSHADRVNRPKLARSNQFAGVNDLFEMPVHLADLQVHATAFRRIDHTFARFNAVREGLLYHHGLAGICSRNGNLLV